MPGQLIKVGQVWTMDSPWVRGDNREYHIVISVGDIRSPWGIVRKALTNILRGGKIVRENSFFTEVDANNYTLDPLIGWTCVSRNGLAGLEKKLKREIQKLKNPPVYRKTQRKQYRDRLIAEALTGTKPIA